MEFISALIEVIGNCLLNVLGFLYKERSKVYFKIISIPQEEYFERRSRIKTDSSDFGIEMFNTGKNTIIVEYLSLIDKNSVLVDCFFDDSYCVVSSSHSAVYHFSEEDVDALEYHCNQKQIESCEVVAHCIDGKRIKGKVDLFPFALHSDRAYIDNVYEE